MMSDDYGDFAAEFPDSFTIDIFGTEWTAWGYEPAVVLHVETRAGRYWVEFTRSNGNTGTIAWEPAEPDVQRAGIKHVLAHPDTAVADLLTIDREQRKKT